MEEKYKLFDTLIKELDRENMLNSLILIGSWCLHVYKDYFKESSRISELRTLDVDFLIKLPLSDKTKRDIPKLLNKLGFENSHNYIDGMTKYIHEDLEIEFLTNKRGSGEKDIHKINELNIEAVSLRYLNILEDNIKKIKYKNVLINLPEPGAFVLHKIIISERRKNNDKKVKDLDSAITLGEFLTEENIEKQKMKEIFASLHPKWQRNILNILQGNSNQLFEFFYK